MVYFIIAAIIIFIIYMFQSDKKETINKNLGSGGLSRRFPNFVAYSRQAYTSNQPYLQFVKDDGRYLEYKFPVQVDRAIAGYYYLGIESVFGTFAYVYAVSSKGVKINGYIREIHNGKNNNVPRDRAIEEYEIIFDSLISQMERSKDFEKKFYGIFH